MSNSSHDPLAWIDAELESLARAGLRRRLAERGGPQRARVTLDGKSLVNFGCNDYLGLAADERLAAAARAAIECEGWGSGASPLVSGRSSVHAELERRLAEFEGTEAALVFPSGFAANAGVIPALVEEPDAIFADAKNHASLIDGCRLSRAARFVYPHGDSGALEEHLHNSGRFRRRLIVTDTLFSMDGDLAPLAELAELAERYGAMLMVDEAHATGVFGRRGRGVVEHLDARCSMLDAGSDFQRPASSIQHPVSSISLHDRIHIRVGTLSKALGTGGGFVCGRQSLIDWLANRARTYIFSTAQPAATSAAALAALDIVHDEPHRREQLLAAAAELRLRLREQGWNLSPPLPPVEDLPSRGEGRGEGSSSQIIPLYVGEPERAVQLASRLRKAGFFVPAIRPPSVPKGESLLRLSLCYPHTAEMVDDLVRQLDRLR